MSDELLYRGWSIRAEPYKLQGGGWTFEGVLLETASPHRRRVYFYFAGTTDSRETALQLILEEGKRLIDFRSLPP